MDLARKSFVQGNASWRKFAWGEPKMVAAINVTLGQGASPGGGITLEADDCHVGRDAASNPTAKLGRDSSLL